MCLSHKRVSIIFLYYAFSYSECFDHWMVVHKMQQRDGKSDSNYAKHWNFPGMNERN